MLVLSDGRGVALSVDRARYHALRKQIPQTAGHRQLYAVVDVIYRTRHDHGGFRMGWREFDYRYAGYTVADVRLAEDWSANDKQRFYDWLCEPAQQRLIESSRTRLIGCQTDISVKNSTAPAGLHSALVRWLQSTSLQRASVAQWRASLQNLAQFGLRQDELHWSGVRDFLKSLPDTQTLTLQQLLAAIDFRNIRLEMSLERIWDTQGQLAFREVALKFPHQAQVRAALKLDRSCYGILRYVNDDYNYRVGVVKTLAYGHYQAMNRYWFVLDSYGRPVCDESRGMAKYYDSSAQAMRAANRHATEQLGVRGGVRNHTRYDYLTLHGGDDYREWLIMLPDYQRTFFGAHFYDHNVLAHVRTTTRVDHQGRHLLFIEELQSDWHQQGAIHGYDNNPWGEIPFAPFRNEWVSLVCKLMLLRALQNGYDGIAWASGQIQALRYTGNLSAIVRRYDAEIPQILARIGKCANLSVTSTQIETRDPWLNVVRKQEKWQVADGAGKFRTRPRYSREQAMEIARRHSRVVSLEVAAFLFNDVFRQKIGEQGLPLFGEKFV
ncbi:MAG: hypothetical protein OEW58_08500 [Gammaproteobacteria bacterium]|nr:hypothetical protein [Gammaproteobacteria bacterium]